MKTERKYLTKENVRIDDIVGSSYNHETSDWLKWNNPDLTHYEFYIEIWDEWEKIFGKIPEIHQNDSSWINVYLLYSNFEPEEIHAIWIVDDGTYKHQYQEYIMTEQEKQDMIELCRGYLGENNI